MTKMVVATVAETKPKRGPGRPRKYKAKDSVENYIPKRGPGRPRKTPIPDIVDREQLPEKTQSRPDIVDQTQLPAKSTPFRFRKNSLPGKPPSAVRDLIDGTETENAIVSKTEIENWEMIRYEKKFGFGKGPWQWLHLFRWQVSEVKDNTGKLFFRQKKMSWLFGQFSWSNTGTREMVTE